MGGPVPDVLHDVHPPPEALHMHLSSWPRATLFGTVAVLAFAAAQLMTPSASLAIGPAPVPRLDWRACGEPFECATAEVPRQPRPRRNEERQTRATPETASQA